MSLYYLDFVRLQENMVKKIPDSFILAFTIVLCSEYSI